MIVIFLMQS